MSLVWPKIVLFGDSQVQRAFDPATAPWGAFLANRFQRVADVITRGFSGYTSRSGRIILPRIFCPENISGVEAFVIFLGTNDLSGKLDASPNHVPVEEYSENLEEMITFLQSIGLRKDKIILVTPGPFHAGKFKKWCHDTGRNFPIKDEKLVPEYVEACLSVAKKHDLDSINIFEEMKKDEEWPRFLIDGLHFATDGAKLIYQLLRPILEKKIDPSEMLLPYWQDINHIKPEDNNDDICFKKCPNLTL
ncbi:Isoamyl acetate-hydrolyzing esterase 1 [Araneus ventricosus]|uniref:Isoamyl acetate-hydrolyzing esterase 1 n=1 Tax=Araneus ventricosus TaxID=182803 RepID=A0A4Y2BGM2_ARAVE|nr:Isoamyl acetate-hydrolyzing esterase 1 [Araneus ventricosus]